MKKFDPRFFKKEEMVVGQIQLYFSNSLRDLKIAKEDDFVEVKFNYAYQALIKSGIALLAKVGGVKVRSVPGHHLRIISNMAEILKNPDIDSLGNAMRNKRNLDLYEGGIAVGESEVEEYIQFVESVIGSVATRLGLSQPFSR